MAELLVTDPIILDDTGVRIASAIEDLATIQEASYTFVGGVNGFTAVPKGKDPISVAVTPSIDNASTSAAGLMSAEDKTKLNGIAAGSQVNVIEDVKVNGTSLTVSNKAVDVSVPTKTSDLTNDSNFPADAGYVHTDNNFTNALKSKLEGIAEGAEVNVQADWTETDTGVDSYIQHKPTKLSDFTNDLGTASTKNYATAAIGASGEDTNALPTVGQIETYVSNKVTGSMHFKGIFDQLPATTDYEAGDVVIVNVYNPDSEGEPILAGRKEYVLVDVSGTKSWEELGDEEGLYATTVQLNAVKGTGWNNETVKGNADDIKVLDTSTEGLQQTIGNTQSPVSEGTVLYRLNSLENAPAASIASSDISAWNAKQNAIVDGSATVASIANDIVTIKNVSQSSGAIATGTDAVVLAKVAKTGAAADITDDASHRFVTDTEKANWNANHNYINSVNTEFNVDSEGKLGFASGYNALTDAQLNKLADIQTGATKVEASSTNGNIKINNTETTVYSLPGAVVSDANYAHITVTGSSVSDGTSTFNKYTHPAGSAASQGSGFYKFSTDANSHIASVTNVNGSDIAGLLNFITAYDANDNKIATAADIAGGIHFKGVTHRNLDSEGQPAETYAQALARFLPNPENGDMAIVDTKEFIYSESSWTEIGDENAWDTKGSAAAAELNAINASESYANGLIEALDSSINEVTDSEGHKYAVTGFNIVNGLITSSTSELIPTVPRNISAFNNDSNYATQSYVSTAIQNAILDAIDGSY